MRKLRKKEKNINGDVFTPYLAKLADEFPKIDFRITDTRIFVYRKYSLTPFARFTKQKQGWEDSESLLCFTSPKAAIRWAAERALLV